MDPRFHFDASFTFEAEPAEVWRALADPERYRQWVPGLRVIEGGHLAPGATTHAVIQAPLPYRLHLSFRVLAVDPGRRVDVEVGGDLAGPGLLEIATAGDGSRLRLAWDVEAHDRGRVRAPARLVGARPGDRGRRASLRSRPRSLDALRRILRPRRAVRRNRRR
jgi:uncharacterized protein YndB with AHSA1/START domain